MIYGLGGECAKPINRSPKAGKTIDCLAGESRRAGFNLLLFVERLKQIETTNVEHSTSSTFACLRASVLIGRPQKELGAAGAPSERDATQAEQSRQTTTMLTRLSVILIDGRGQTNWRPIRACHVSNPAECNSCARKE